MTADPGGHPHPEKPSWAKRRLVLYAVLGFCFGIIIYLVGWGADNRLNDTIATLAFATIILCTQGYVFGAVIDDWHFMKVFGKGNGGTSTPVPAAARGGSP